MCEVTQITAAIGISKDFHKLLDISKKPTTLSPSSLSLIDKLTGLTGISKTKILRASTKYRGSHKKCFVGSSFNLMTLDLSKHQMKLTEMIQTTQLLCENATELQKLKICSNTEIANKFPQLQLHIYACGCM